MISLSRCVLFIILFLCSFRAHAQDAMTLLYPDATPRLAKTRSATVVGRMTSKDLAQVRLLTPARASVWLRMTTKEDKDGFAAAVKALFPERFLLTKAVFTAVLQRTRKEDRRQLDFTLESNTGLKEFWANPSFKDVYASLFSNALITVRVEIEGWTVQSMDAREQSSHLAATEVFVMSTVLVPGKNDLLLQALAADRRVLQSTPVSFFLANDYTADAPKSDGRVLFHSSTYASVCADCHPIEIPPAAMNGGSSVKDQCSPCHTPLATQKNVHFPVSEWDCLTCHDADAKPQFALYADKDFNTGVCGDCHGDINDAVKQAKVQHYPATDRCLACHDPHGSTERALLVDRVNTICAACHFEMSKTPHPVANHPLATAERPSAQVRQLDCASCHEPHASAIPKLARATGMALCSTCHQY